MDKEVQERFDRIFAKQNGYYDLDRLNGMPDERATFQEVLNVCEAGIKQLLPIYKNPPNVYIAFVNDQALGATVIKDDGDYFIGLYMGSIIILHGIFGRMLCSPKVLPMLGDISQEETQKITNPFILSADIIFDNILNYPEQLRFPKDEQRRNAVLMLTNVAMQFLTLHELGHVIRGHYAYKLNKGKLETIISQGLEFDADFYAMHNGMVIFRNTYFMVELTPDQHKRMMGLWLFAVSCLSRLCGLILHNSERLEEYSHPPAGMRLFMLLRNYERRLIKESEAFFGEKLSSENIKDLIKNCIKDVENGFIESGDDDETLLQGLNSIIFAAQHFSHSDKVMEALDGIWSEIESYKIESIYS